MLLSNLVMLFPLLPFFFVFTTTYLSAVLSLSNTLNNWWFFWCLWLSSPGNYRVRLVTLCTQCSHLMADLGVMVIPRLSSDNSSEPRAKELCRSSFRRIIIRRAASLWFLLLCCNVRRPSSQLASALSLNQLYNLDVLSELFIHPATTLSLVTGHTPN